MWKKVKKTLDTYRENVVYLDIRFREKRRALTKTNHLLSLMAFWEMIADYLSLVWGAAGFKSPPFYSVKVDGGDEGWDNGDI